MELTDRESERLYGCLQKIRAISRNPSPPKNAIPNLCDKCSVILRKAGRRKKKLKTNNTAL